MEFVCSWLLIEGAKRAACVLSVKMSRKKFEVKNNCRTDELEIFLVD